MSIRTHLILWLSVFLSGIWIFVATLTFLSTRSEVEDLFDTKLAQTASVLSQIQDPSADDQIVKQTIYVKNKKRIMFQIWEGNKLVLRSPMAPNVPMSMSAGFSLQLVDQLQWRVFHLTDPESQRDVFTAERQDVRDDLIRETTLEVILPLSIALPFSIVMIWFTIGRALAPVDRLADQVANLSPQNLDPIDTPYRIPREISPLLSALNSLLAKLRTTFERERRFTADAAHELQTPLASIKTQVQVALRTNDSQARDHALHMVEEGVNRTSRLVHQLLTLARYDPGSVSHIHDKVNISELLTQVVAEFVPVATQKQLDLGLEAQQGIFHNGNSAGLHILFRNLIDNAVRYTPAQGKITVKVIQDSNNISVKVCDTGPGIPQAEHERIFERFYRGKNQQHVAGSGLGMSIARQITEMHQGHIELATDVNTGEFCIIVSFPVTQLV